MTVTTNQLCPAWHRHAVLTGPQGRELVSEDREVVGYRTSEYAALGACCWVDGTGAGDLGQRRTLREVGARTLRCRFAGKSEPADAELGDVVHMFGVGLLDRLLGQWLVSEGRSQDQPVLVGRRDLTALARWAVRVCRILCRADPLAEVRRHRQLAPCHLMGHDNCLDTTLQDAGHEGGVESLGAVTAHASPTGTPSVAQNARAHEDVRAVQEGGWRQAPQIRPTSLQPRKTQRRIGATDEEPGADSIFQEPLLVMHVRRATRAQGVAGQPACWQVRPEGGRP